MESARIILQVT